MGILDAYFGVVAPDYEDDEECVEGTKKLLRNIHFVHRPTTHNITLQCEKEDHSVDGEFAPFLIHKVFDFKLFNG